jgi:hypothetical protein
MCAMARPPQHEFQSSSAICAGGCSLLMQGSSETARVQRSLAKTDQRANFNLKVADRANH